MASGDTSSWSTQEVTFAANCARVVFASLQPPKVTRTRKILPVIFDVRCTKPVRRAVVSMTSEEKNSVNMPRALGVYSVMAVSCVQVLGRNPHSILTLRGDCYFPC